jgi:hypothetical protein|tara:strand:- start:1307 stop:1552 length:246 start_codon:yes stop_codon:yes gene_type:complete
MKTNDKYFNSYKYEKPVQVEFYPDELDKTITQLKTIELGQLDLNPNQFRALMKVVSKLNTFNKMHKLTQSEPDAVVTLEDE